MIGNAVPVLLAYNIAKKIFSDLFETKKPQKINKSINIIKEQESFVK